MSFNDIIKFLGEKWVSNVFGMLGGVLGLWTFVDSYLRRFKPKIFIGTQVFFKKSDNSEADKTKLDSILLSVEIFNKRKKHGLVYDIAIRLFKDDEINPKSIVYYASELYSDIIINEPCIKTIGNKPFSPIAVLPTASKSINVLFGSVIHSSKTEMHHSHCCIEVYYQSSPNGRWKFVSKHNLYNHSSDYKHKNFENAILLSPLNYDKTRQKLSRYSKHITSISKGAYQNYLKWIAKRSGIVCLRILLTIKNIFLVIGIEVSFFISRLIDNKLKKPIIKKYSKGNQGNNITFGNKIALPFTIDGINQLYSELIKLSDEINKALKKEAITIKKNKDDLDSFNLFSSGVSLVIYKSGDMSITVNELNSKNGSRIRYTINQEKLFLNRRYWKLQNSGYISLDSFAIKILDAVSLFSGFSMNKMSINFVKTR